MSDPSNTAPSLTATLAASTTAAAPATVGAAPTLATVEAELETIKAAEPKAMTPIEALDAWLDGLRNGPVSQNTVVWNEVFDCTIRIKAALATLKGV